MTAAAARELRAWSAGLTAGFLGILVIVAVLAIGNVKLLVAVLGGVLTLVGAVLSGNPRLFFLWGLMLTLPFDLSKRFGPVIAKMGGETSFRVEMSDPFMLALLAFLLADALTGRRHGLRVPRVAYWWGLLLALGCAWVLLGTYRMSAAQEVLRMAKVIALFVVLSNELARPGRILQAAAALSFSVTLQALVAVYQYVTREHLGLEMLGETGAGTSEKLMATTVEAERTFRAGAFLSHPNIFAVFLACLLPLVIGLFLVAPRKRTRALLLVTISTGTAALVGTLSRSGWISFAVALAVLLTLMLFHRRLRQRVRLAAGLFVGVLMVVGVIFWEPISKRIFESKEHAVRSRLEHIGTASRMILTRPLEGFGLNSYAPAALSFTKEGPRAALDKYQGPKEYPGLWLPPVHNIYLLWWAEIGLVGLVLHLVVLGQVIRAGLSNLRVESDQLFVVNAACVAGIAALMVDGLASFSLRINSILRVFWVLAALIVAVRYWRLGQEPARHEVPVGSDAQG